MKVLREEKSAIPAEQISDAALPASLVIGRGRSGTEWLEERRGVVENLLKWPQPIEQGSEGSSPSGKYLLQPSK